VLMDPPTDCLQAVVQILDLLRSMMIEILLGSKC
jgi:hypothetical protein